MTTPGYKAYVIKKWLQTSDITIDGLTDKEKRIQEAVDEYKQRGGLLYNRDVKVTNAMLHIPSDYPCDDYYSSPEIYLVIDIEYELTPKEIAAEARREEKRRVAERKRRLRNAEVKAAKQRETEERERKELVKLAKRYPDIAKEVVLNEKDKNS